MWLNRPVLNSGFHRWDAGPWQVTPQHFYQVALTIPALVPMYSWVERGTIFCPRTQFSDPSPSSNPDHLIWSLMC